MPTTMQPRPERKEVPLDFGAASDTTSVADISWRVFFTDPNLVALIDTALSRNQELNIVLQEINMARNEVRARRGEYLPFVRLTAGTGIERVARYTRSGAVEANTEIAPRESFPAPLPDYNAGALASWQVDIWKKLRNARKAAMARYLATNEGKNFLVTQLVAEIASTYYQLLALDQQLMILNQNITIQKNALEIVRLEKEAAKTTELAVRRFEAEVWKNQSHVFSLQQQIVEMENHINFLIGSFPRPVVRSKQPFMEMTPGSLAQGVPVQLLRNRPDVRRAERALEAAKLDVLVARADFYPNLTILAGVGLQAFRPSLLGKPQSVFYGLGGGLLQPLINRNALKAQYYSANARQIQAVYGFEQAVLRAYIEVVNQLSNLKNLEGSLALQSNQVDALTESIAISGRLFRSARADYMEVLLTQRDALESRFELVDTKREQMVATVELYRALGGGWK